MFEYQRAIFAEAFGRYPDRAESYLIHQQGIDGALAHMKNPDVPAWENMYSTDEGHKRGRGWAKLAIWGNLPRAARQAYGSVDKVTSKQFVQCWRSRMETGSWPVVW
jgi:hypothetical protein